MSRKRETQTTYEANDGDAALTTYEDSDESLEACIRCYRCGFYLVHETTCGNEALLQIWNTRAVPTMKAWEWVASNTHSQAWRCKAFKALVYRGSYAYNSPSEPGVTEVVRWHAYIGNVMVAEALEPDDAKAACAAYVEGKLGEWLL